MVAELHAKLAILGNLIVQILTGMCDIDKSQAPVRERYTYITNHLKKIEKNLSL
mgnify:CR=1 FL=1